MSINLTSDNHSHYW